MRLSITPFLLLTSSIGVGGANVPTAYVTAGGGFKTMTLSMGIIRAIYEQGILPFVTHWGCCSGGCWFQTQFAYSEDFHDDMLGLTNLTVHDAIADWGTGYSASMTEATIQGLLQNISFTVTTQSPLCLLDIGNVNGTTYAEIIEAALNGLAIAVQWPAYDWHFYVNALIGTTVSGGTVKTFAAPRKGYPYGTIVASVTLPPDVFDNTGFVTPKLSGQTEDIELLPIHFSAVPGEEGEWRFPSTDKSKLKVENGRGKNKEKVDLGLSPAATLSEVNAATSSAAGMFGSPSMFDAIISNTLDGPEFDNLTFIEKQTYKLAMEACEPLGLQNVSAPVLATTSDQPTSWSPRYRYLDGGYSEDSGLVASISRMQHDCNNDDSGEFDCSGGVRAMLIYGAGVGQFESVPRLFADCNCGNSQFDDLGTAINSQIFAEPYPSDLSDPGWTLYDNTTYFFSNETSVSYAWRGTVTTIDNPGYNVEKGTSVDLIMIFVDLPSEDPLIWPGFAADFAFSTFYGVIAEQNYNSLTPYFAALTPDWMTLGVGGGTKKAKKEKGAKAAKKDSKKNKKEN